MNIPQPILINMPIIADTKQVDWFMIKFSHHVNSESYSHLQVVKHEEGCQTHLNVILLEKEKMKQLYALKNIPNDYDGWDFIRKVKKYLNKEDYTFKVRGQKLMDGFKSTDLDCRYSYPIEKSKLLRAYFHNKKPQPKPKPKPEPTYIFDAHVTSKIVRTDSYLGLTAKSEAEAKSLVESGLLIPDDTRYPDCEVEIKYGVIKNYETGKTLSWEN
tara:strand:+ start:863 stop:1507 length:645 start_codon:yes stop_codon:yes gene_type:complete